MKKLISFFLVLFYILFIILGTAYYFFSLYNPNHLKNIIVNESVPFVLEKYNNQLNQIKENLDKIKFACNNYRELIEEQLKKYNLSCQLLEKYNFNYSLIKKEIIIPLIKKKIEYEINEKVNEINKCNTLECFNNNINLAFLSNKFIKLIKSRIFYYFMIISTIFLILLIVSFIVYKSIYKVLSKLLISSIIFIILYYLSKNYKHYLINYINKIIVENYKINASSIVTKIVNYFMFLYQRIFELFLFKIALIVIIGFIVSYIIEWILKKL